MMETKGRKPMTTTMRMPPYRILLVDDDEFICDVVRRTLVLPMYKVETLDGPMGATNTARQFKPDIVLLDLNMPAISGAKLFSLMRTAALSATNGKTLFFLYSADCEEELRRVTKEQSFDGYFSKSSSLVSIEKKLRHLMTSSPSSLPPPSR
jgi:DNA-binding response OmpR family regulator